MTVKLKLRVLHHGKSGLTYHRRLLPIACQDDWENYVNGVMKNEIPLIDLLVSKLSHDSSPHMHSPSGNNCHSPPRELSPEKEFPAPPDPPIANRSGNVQHMVVVPDAESDPNFDGISHDPAAQCHNHDDVTPAQEIPLSQNHPRDIAYNIAIPSVPPATSTGRASNSVEVQIEDDEEPYETARAVDSDDDRYVGTAPLTEEESELLRRLCPDRDPLVPEFSDLRHCQGAFAKGREDELLEPHETGDRSELAKGLLFKDLASVCKWLQEYSMKRKRPFRVVHSYVNRCYTVVHFYVNRRYTVDCEKAGCNWRACARKQKLTGKFKITKVVGPHTCAENELQLKHRQLTSTLIANKLCHTLKYQPNLSVRMIINYVQDMFGYMIKYGKAWRAKQRAWKMIYGDWEEGFKKLSALLNAMKAGNPGMHYEYIPKPNAWSQDRRQFFWRAFWCFPQTW
ncbi:uncharacterized protein LOC120702766 [Panicum virgatum]|uniref:uncharacterized protein LOC120702766 n=1 Tax=Panicum virgatum TaxID=38727 RepID=UPI0019D5BA41|nr:uncharacterized protein LOC120702766 [Panicum virgatum]